MAEVTHYECKSVEIPTKCMVNIEKYNTYLSYNMVLYLISYAATTFHFFMARTKV